MENLRPDEASWRKVVTANARRGSTATELPDDYHQADVIIGPINCNFGSLECAKQLPEKLIKEGKDGKQGILMQHVFCT